MPAALVVLVLAALTCLCSLVAFGLWSWTPWISLFVAGIAIRHIEGNEEADD